MSRYLMNPHSGTVQTADEWAADGFDQGSAELIEVASGEGSEALLPTIADQIRDALKIVEMTTEQTQQRAGQ